MKKHRLRLLVASAAATVSVAAFSVLSFTPPISFVRGMTSETRTLKPPALDTRAYDLALLRNAHVATSSPWHRSFLLGTSTPLDAWGNSTTTNERRPEWPVKVAYPAYGALLPFNRIVAYYGNFYSTRMGVLGEYPREEMLTRLKSAMNEWKTADPATPVIPAIHYIVETAQASPTKSGLYVARMPDDQIDHALELAKEINGLVFIDFQVGLSTVEKELPYYEKYLALPNVHVGIDPEFSMKTGVPPGRVIGTMDAKDVNWVAQYLAGIVREKKLPPKILVVHRFTEDMVTNTKRIEPLPEVQIVMDMDGWGFPAKKVNTYNAVVFSEPVQFTGFKLFYKNDLQPPALRLMTPKEVLDLTPSPIYIQYQ